MTTTTTTTTCSGCSEKVTVDPHQGTVTATRPSNGRRGSLHIGAAVLTLDIESIDDDLICWECPLCGYADSYDRHYGG